jgi:hypothetical protein
MCIKENAHEHTGSAEAVRPSLRNGLTAYFVLSPVTGLFATVGRIGFSTFTALAPASGRQDHTTSPCAQCHSSGDIAAPIASRTNVRDDRDTPLASE